MIVLSPILWPKGVIVSNDEIDIVVNFVMNVEYDSNGMSQFIQQTAQYRRRGVRLEGAIPGMNVVILPWSAACLVGLLTEHRH